MLREDKEMNKSKPKARSNSSPSRLQNCWQNKTPGSGFNLLLPSLRPQGKVGKVLGPRPLSPKALQGKDLQGAERRVRAEKFPRFTWATPAPRTG